MKATDLIKHDIDITSHTTFGIPVRTRMYAEYANVRQLEALSRTQEYLNSPVLHIGEGSNLLFLHDFDGLVLHCGIRGFSRYEKNPETVYAIAGAGERMDDFIAWTLEQGLSGLENLSGIPGEVGAAAVQNVGAYGVEAGDYIHSVECFDTMSRKTVMLSREECQFGYRDSRFKREWKGRYFILRVSFRLNHDGKAKHLDYGPLKAWSGSLGHQPTPEELRSEVIRLRNEKLPDPKVVGSAGSFFKNPVGSEYYFREEVLRREPDVPSYRVDDHSVKVPAGWLIEHAGLKGYRIGGAEVYPKQCLVIANTGNATAADVTALAQHVENTVMQKYGIRLSREVNYIDTSIKVTVLGSGTSKGIPEIGCRCEVCQSEDPHDKRMRASVLVQTNDQNILIDVSPDFRSQALLHDIHDVDAVLLTHSHYDHVGGLDDLRPMCVFGDVPLYMRSDVNGDLHRRLDYCFREHPYPGVPQFETHVIDSRPFDINGVKIVPIEVFHGKLPIYGYRIGNFAYITDANSIEQSEKEKLYGVDTLIVNALRHRKHFAHFSIDQALDLIREIQPRQAYLTHLSHEAGTHIALDKELPDNVHPAYDGLAIRVGTNIYGDEKQG